VYDESAAEVAFEASDNFCAHHAETERKEPKRFRQIATATFAFHLAPLARCLLRLRAQEMPSHNESNLTWLRPRNYIRKLKALFSICGNNH
jgi:hypothetical protein